MAAAAVTGVAGAADVKQSAPIAGGLVVPRLTGVPRTIGSAASSPSHVRLALSLISAGVAPATFTARTPIDVIRETVDAFARRYNHERFDNWFGLQIRLDTTIDPWHSEGPGENGRLFLCLEPVNYNILELGPAFTWLAGYDAGLPYVLWTALCDLQKMVPLYTWSDAIDWWEEMKYQSDEESIAERETEFGVPTRPALLDARKLPRRAITRELRDLKGKWPADVRRLVEASAALSEALPSGRFRHMLRSEDEELLGDFDGPFPLMLIVENRRDATEAAFDDSYLVHGEQMPRTPYHAWELRAHEPRHIAGVFRELGQALTVYQAFHALLTAIPPRGKLPNASLAAVFAEPDVQVIQYERGAVPVNRRVRVRV